MVYVHFDRSILTTPVFWVLVLSYRILYDLSCTIVVLVERERMKEYTAPRHPADARTRRLVHEVPFVNLQQDDDVVTLLQQWQLALVCLQIQLCYIVYELQ